MLKKKIASKNKLNSSFKSSSHSGNKGDFFYATKKVEGFRQKDGWVKSHERTIKVSVAWVAGIAAAWWFGNKLWNEQRKLNKDLATFTDTTRKTLGKHSELISKQQMLLEKNTNVLAAVIKNPGFQAYAREEHNVQGIVPVNQANRR